MDYPASANNIFDIAKKFFSSIIISDTFLTITSFIIVKTSSFLGRTLIEKASDLLLSKVIKAHSMGHSDTTMPHFTGNESTTAPIETENQQLVIASDMENSPKESKASDTETADQAKDENGNGKPDDGTTHSIKLGDNTSAGENAIAMYWMDGTSTVTITTNRTPPVTAEPRSIISPEAMLTVFFGGVFCFLLGEVLKLLGGPR